MAGLEGKVAFITGGARGQGRVHAVRLASLGADILIVDVCTDNPAMDYPNASEAELAETAQLVEKEGRHCWAHRADVRHLAELRPPSTKGSRSWGAATS